MAISVVEMFSIGIGPSSSHTVGPMLGAALFARELADQHAGSVTRIEIDLFGSLAATGRGHGTPGAILAGLEGADPKTVDPAHVLALANGSCRSITLVGGTTLPLDDVAVTFRTDRKEFRHSTTVELRAFAPDGSKILERRLFSVGGGFVEFDEPDGNVKSTPCVEGASTGRTHPAGFHQLRRAVLRLVTRLPKLRTPCWARKIRRSARTLLLPCLVRRSRISL